MKANNQQRIAFKGSKFTIEWYFDNQNKSQALDYFNQLTLARKKKLDNLLRLMAERGCIYDITKFRNEGDGIYVFKPKPDRFFCFFFTGSKIIITNAYEKRLIKCHSQTRQKLSDLIVIISLD
ncbi:hypothetical protein KBB68_03290 [Candidatus Babeliales bacterium]|nr:hypothetical protein [Candidatus Babeliales bacterium]